MTATYVALIPLTPKASIKELFILTRKNFVRYLVAGLLSGILMLIRYGLGLAIMASAEALIFIGAIIMMLGMALVSPLALLTPIVALQQQVSGWKALKLTRSYVKGNFAMVFWNIVGFTLLSIAIMWAVMFALIILGGLSAFLLGPWIILPGIILYVLINYLYQASMFHFLVEIINTIKQ